VSSPSLQSPQSREVPTGDGDIFKLLKVDYMEQPIPKDKERNGLDRSQSWKIKL